MFNIDNIGNGTFEPGQGGLDPEKVCKTLETFIAMIRAQTIHPQEVALSVVSKPEQWQQRELKIAFVNITA